jgi:hypothetical protein
MAQSERALQVENDDAFPFPLFDVQTHGQPPLTPIGYLEDSLVFGGFRHQPRDGLGMEL